MRVLNYDKALHYDGEILGASTDLLFDQQECKTLMGRDGIIHQRNPERIDILLGAPSRRVIGVESKMPSDLVSSHASRRLARQLTVLHDMVDVSVLLLRGFDLLDLERAISFQERHNRRYRGRHLWADLQRYQNNGVRILFCGPLDSEVLEVLNDSRKAIGVPFSKGAFAGSDKRRS